ncbi:hypothetical protein BCON_0037g00170 [Botryotinia convoluta]|uniref:Uncharacterized protein n=1 Tax=Botryotinia convoluta TaxID=54673 RepID=A0A4Z1IUA5_9HELO|nr:hypothetical protein BCON_0037g00170 [Botryotinia convoluta]
MPPLPPPKKSPFPRFSNEMSYHENPFFEATLHETHPYVPYVPAQPQKQYLAIPAVPSGAPMQPIGSQLSEPPLLLILFKILYWMGNKEAVGEPDLDFEMEHHRGVSAPGIKQLFWACSDFGNRESKKIISENMFATTQPSDNVDRKD